MSSSHAAPKYFDILAARRAYAEGRNVTALLRDQKGLDRNTSDIIETAYDLQAGTYIQGTEQNKAHALRYAAEMAGILQRHTLPQDALLDIGTGELTTLSLLLACLEAPPRQVLAFDISWSRVHKGLAYAQRNMGEAFQRLLPFVADIAEIPLVDQAVDVTISSHALEPNGGQLKALMTELFRVTRRKLLLFEPSYETNSEEGRQRMDRLGYIKGMDQVVADLGGKMIDKIAIEHTANPLNPTVCFVIEPPAAPAASRDDEHERTTDAWFSVPGTNHPLVRMDGFYFSNATGLCFPVLKALPVLKSGSAILASALSQDGVA